MKNSAGGLQERQMFANPRPRRLNPSEIIRFKDDFTVSFKIKGRPIPVRMNGTILLDQDVIEDIVILSVFFIPFNDRAVWQGLMIG